MLYGLFGKSGGIGKTAHAAGAVVQAARIRTTAIGKYHKGRCHVGTGPSPFACPQDLYYTADWSEKPSEWSGPQWRKNI